MKQIFKLTYSKELIEKYGKQKDNYICTHRMTGVMEQQRDDDEKEYKRIVGEMNYFYMDYKDMSPPMFKKKYGIQCNGLDVQAYVRQKYLGE